MHIKELSYLYKRIYLVIGFDIKELINFYKRI